MKVMWVSPFRVHFIFFLKKSWRNINFGPLFVLIPEVFTLLSTRSKSHVFDISSLRSLVNVDIVGITVRNSYHLLLWAQAGAIERYLQLQSLMWLFILKVSSSRSNFPHSQYLPSALSRRASTPIRLFLTAECGQCRQCGYHCAVWSYCSMECGVWSVVWGCALPSPAECVPTGPTVRRAARNTSPMLQYSFRGRLFRTGGVNLLQGIPSC